MDYRHTPVLLEECMEALRIRPDGVYADGTIGGAGHSLEICRRLSGRGTLIGIDRDQDALDAASARLADTPPKKFFVRSSFADIKCVLAECGIDGIDGALLDLGVSSFQLDNPERGFSYMHDAPLDMRMDQRQTLTARDVVNGYSREELTDIIRKYGEERWASRIAAFIEQRRRVQSIETTAELVAIIKDAVPASARRTGPHPAKRTFQAIRIEVNNELGELEEALDAFCDVLRPYGRLCVITFHSLEDRIVKQKFMKRENPCECPPELPVCVCGKVSDAVRVTKKPVVPAEKEVERNPRARSAKLRVLEKRDTKEVKSAGHSSRRKKSSR